MPRIKNIIATLVIAMIMGTWTGIIYSFKFGDSSLRDFLTGFSFFELGLVIIFLIFIIPIERGWINRRSILWKILTWHEQPKKIREEISLCEIPEMVIITIFLGIIWLIFFLGGNAFLPVISGKYFDFKLKEKEIPVINKLSFRGKQIRPWMIILIVAVIYSLVLLAKWLSTNIVFFYRTLAILSAIGAGAGFIWLLIEFGAIKSIRNFLLVIHKKMCTTRKIPD